MKGTGNRVHVCTFCGDEFRRWTDNAVYCSRDCMSADYRTRLIGAGNPVWRGGKWKYKGSRWPGIAAAVIARDGACADCGTTDGLIAHHLIPQRFWIDLHAANEAGNLLTLCTTCHGRRPEHYWRTLADSLFIDGVHIQRPTVHRTSGDHLRPYPTCVCGEPCKRHRSRFCSYACSNRSRWADGIYSREFMAAQASAANRASVLARANRKRLKRFGDV